MSDITPPEQKLVDPPRRERALVWTALVSLALHAGVLVVILWSPLRDAMEAAPTQAIEVELVPPPEAEASEQDASETPSPDAASSSEMASAETSEADAAAPSPSAPSATETSEAPPPGTQEPPRTPLAEPAETVAAPGSSPAPAAAEASTSPPVETPPATQAPGGPPPTPLPRPASRTSEPGAEGTAAPSGEPVAALEADTGEAEGDVPGALSAEPAVAALELGETRNAQRFYLEAMLSEPSLARVRDMLETLPREKRLSQTCNIEALAQIGNSGEGFAPDVVMTDAYAMSEMTGTRLSATGAIFRSKDKWYGVAFDCTLSDDLTQVTGFSYRLGADVTEAVLARLGQR